MIPMWRCNEKNCSVGNNSQFSTVNFSFTTTGPVFFMQGLNEMWKIISEQFRIEIEKNDRWPFLDTVLIKSDHTIITDWFNKSTCSGRVINFNSHRLFSQKLNLIDNLNIRAILFSNKCFQSFNFDEKKSILLHKNYRRKLWGKNFKW